MKIKLMELSLILVVEKVSYSVEYRYNQQEDLWELWINGKMIRYTGKCGLAQAKAHLRRHINETTEG